MSVLEDERIRTELTKDVEKDGKKSSSRAILRNQLWRVVRDIDFSHCQDTAMLMVSKL